MIYPLSNTPSKYPVHVFHLIAELSIGGAQSALYRLVKSFDNQRFQSQVTCLYNGDGVIARQIQAAGIPVYDLGMTRKYRLDAFWRLYRLIKNHRPTILHTWMFHGNILGRLVGSLAGVPIIISSERTMGQESRLRCWINRRTTGLTDAIICVSQSVAKFAQGTIGLPAEKLVVIPNGIELWQFEHLHTQIEARVKYNLPLEPMIIGAIGRPRFVKGYPYLVDAFQQLARVHPAVMLVFVGNGPDRPKLIDQVRSSGLENRVIFMDDKDDIPDLLPALDILASPSLYEGMPNVVIEAMAAGLPVVATSVGGTPEVVVDGDTGILVPPYDSEALAKALSRVLLRQDLRYQMGQAGRQRAFQMFNIRNTIQQTQLLYERLYNDLIKYVE